MPEEYNLPLGLDIQKVITQAGQVKSILQDLNATAANVGQQTAQAFNQGAQAAQNQGRVIAQQTQAYGTTTRSIENMKDALKDLQNFQLAEKDVAKIRFYNSEIQKLEKQIQQTANIGKAGFDDMGNKIQQAGQKATALTGIFKNVLSSLGIAFSLVTLVNFGKELFNIATRADGIERAFSRIGNNDSLSKLRDQTKGFVSDLDLERLTVKANNFNIPLEKLGTFLLFASERAKDTGANVEQLTQNVIDGIGRKSARIIDNLGISIIEVQQEFKKTGDFTTAVSNIIERDMGKAGVAVDTLADKTNRMGVSWTNAKTAVAGFFARVFNPASADNDIIGDITAKSMKSLGDLSKASSKTLNELVSNQQKVVKSLSDKYTESLTKNETFFSDKSQRQLDDVKKSYGEQLAAAQNVLKNLKEQTRERQLEERLAADILTLDERRAKVTDLKLQASNIVPVTDADKKRVKDLLKQAQDEQDKIDEITGKAQKKRDKEEDSAEKKRLARLKQVNAERLQLQNDYYSAQIEAIDNATVKAVASETVQSQNRIRDLQAQKVLFPELTKEIDRNIENEKQQSAARVLLIIQKGTEDELQARKKSQQDIAKVLKNDTDAQVDEVNSRYDLLLQDAKKAGTLTLELEKALEAQRKTDVDNVIIKGQDDLLKKQEEMALSGIYARKKRESQSEKAFEVQNQTDILKINIEYAKKRLALIATDPAKVKEANDLRKAIQDAQNQITKNVSGQKEDLLDQLGIDPEKLKTATDAVSKLGDIAGGIFDSLASAAGQRVDEIQSQIDVIDSLIDKQQEAVDKEKDLMDKGYANNYANAQRTLEASKAQQAELLKQKQEAMKQQETLQKAQIVADGIAQVSNLVTASTDIFKTFAKIPFIGVPLAIAAIGAMFAGFAVAKITALNAVGGTDKLAEGGTIGGKSHSEGGNKYRSVDGNDRNIIEIERGEEITKRSSAEKHRKLLKAINADDFSGLSMSDASLQELLKGTGVYAQLEVAKEAGQNNITITEQSKQLIINTPGKSEEYLKSMDKRLASIEQLHKSKPTVVDFGDYIVITYYDGYKQKIYKK